MGFSFNALRGRREAHLAEHVTHADLPIDSKDSPAYVADPASSSDGDTLSLEARNEKEIQAHPDQVTAEAQIGQQKAEAAALVWPKKVVYATYAWIWLCFFMLAFQSAVLNQATATAYSEFVTAPAISTAYILSSVIGGIVKLPVGKILNIWGRAEGFLVFFCVYMLGMIIIAASNGVNAYAAGYVFYWIGYDALYLIMDIFVADSSGLRNRAICWAFVSTPFIITAFTAPLAAQSLFGALDRSNAHLWRWGVGLFCIVQPVVFLPLAFVFKFYQRKAERMGIFVRQPSGRTTAQSILHYFWEFDVIGCIILMAAFVFFLLPFSLVTYSRGASGYGGPTFIAMIIIGILLFPAFAAYEWFLAPVQFVKWELFKNRTFVGACSLAAILYFSFYCWDFQYYYFVLVVYNLSLSLTGYMTQIYNVGSTFFGVVFAVWIRQSKHFKYEALCFGLPLMMLGSGLMIHFRGQDADIGYIIMCQIFIAFAGGTLVISESMAVMAASDRSGVPMGLSILSLFTNVGGAIGTTISAAIYGNVFVPALTEKLPADLKASAYDLYLEGYLKYVAYAPGTPERVAINYAYGEVQKWGAVASTCLLILGIPAIVVWKNYNVDKKQNKGNVI